MLISIPTTTTKLKDLFTPEQRDRLMIFRHGNKLVLVFQNLGSQNIYCEKGAEATVAEGSLFAGNGGNMEVAIDTFDYDLNFISEGSENINVRVFPI